MTDFAPLFVVSKNGNIPIGFGYFSTTIGGVATFYITSDLTPEGDALFSNIFSIQATALLNTSVADEVPKASGKSISEDKKTIEVNVVSGSLSTFVPDGTLVYLNVIGI